MNEEKNESGWLTRAIIDKIKNKSINKKKREIEELKLEIEKAKLNKELKALNN